MVSFIFYILVAAVFVEGATELLVKSKIFKSLKEKIGSYHLFLQELLSCGYCTSVWVATVPGLVFAVQTASDMLAFPLLWVFWTVVIQRLSNFIHNIGDRIDKFYLNKG